MTTIGLCLIIKNEKENLERLIGSVRDCVDVVYMTDTGSTDGSIEEMKRVCKLHSLQLKVSKFEWVNNFSKARNFNFSQAKTDWILWLDGDDEFEVLEGEGLRELIANVELQGGTGVNMEYKYVSDEIDESINSHAKLRVVKNGLYSWTHKDAGEVPIHENLFPINEEQTKEFFTKELRVRHHFGEGQAEESKQRNVKILKELEKLEGDDPDPRTVFLLGRELSTVDPEESVGYLKRFIRMEGLEGEMLHASFMIAKYYEKQGRFKEQLKWAIRGIGFHALHPLGYVASAEAYRNMGMWDEVIDMCEQSLKKKIQVNENIAFSEYILKKIASLELANAYNEVGRHEDAEAVIKEISKKLPEKEQLQAQGSLNKVIVDSNKTKLEKAVNIISNNVIAEGSLRKLGKITDNLPALASTLKPTLELKRSLGFNKEWNRGNIVIYSRTGLEEWDESSLDKGIGGSETAVIEMAKRFGRAGYKVTVYGDVAEERVFGNVTYTPSDEIEWADSFDIFISWRNVGVFKNIDIKANKKYLWLHDVPDSSEFYKTVYEKIDKIIVLSRYHRSLLPDVPDEKIYISRNGVDGDLIRNINGVKKNHKKVIYASQPIRGLEALLDIWDDVMKEEPEAELVWAYGWDNYDIMIERGLGSKEFKDRMNSRMEELGVKQLGRIGKEELYKEFKSSGIWAYPTEFPEISCIVAAEAQSCGTFPISTGYAALDETQVVGEKVSIKDFKEMILKQMKTPVLIKGESLVDKFDWNVIADEWMNDLFYGVEWEDLDPLVTVVHITGRLGGMRILKDSLDRQTYKNTELVIIDKHYHERVVEVAELFINRKAIHLPDPSRDNKYKFGLCHAHNAALFVANGELIVFLQDFYDVPKDGIEKFVNVYKNHPKDLISGVDEQYDALNVDWEDKMDIFEGRDIVFGKKQWTSMWMNVGKGRRMSVFAREWEANWAAAPKKVLENLGGWNVDWDKGHGWDNVEIAFRHIESGGKLIIDESNRIKGIRHPNEWQSDPKTANTTRFMAYAQSIQNMTKPKLKMQFKPPTYAKEHEVEIHFFKEEE